MLLVNQLIGFGAAQASAVVGVTFQGGQGTNTASATFSFPAYTCDAGHTVAYICISASNNSRSISGVTVTGNNSGAHTAVQRVGSGTTTANAEIWTATISGDTSIDVSISFGGGTQARGACFVYTASGLSATASATDAADTSSPFAATVTTPAGGYAFAVVGDNNSGSPTVSWTNYTKPASGDNAQGGRTYSTAYFNGSDATGPTATYSAASGGRLAVATFDHT